jgi:hypothetical protein
MTMRATTIVNRATIPMALNVLVGIAVAASIVVGSSSVVSAAAPEGDPDCPTGGTDGDGSTCSANPSGTVEVDCTVYMAPSTIGNYSNLGIYTAAPLNRGDVVPYPEIIIPFLWRIFGVHPERALTDGELWDRYLWEQYVGSIEALDDLNPSLEKGSVFIPGVGCTVNSMLDLANIRSARGSQYDEVVDRTSPGAGSFSPYHSCATTVSALHGVQPGQELFASYGEAWIPWIPDVAVTLEGNFHQADALMDELEAWIVQHEEGASPDGGDSTEVTDELLEAMWKFMVNFPHKSRPLSVLPKEWSRERLQRKKKLAALASTTDRARFASTSKDYWAGKGTVSIDFLKEHGRCQDHIRPDISTLPHAGRGAFATRDLPKGTVVGYAPLVHVAIRGDDIFQVTYDRTSTKENYTKPDLVVNYSFGHNHSSLYLTPYGAMVNYINHQSTNDGANVRVQWPTGEMVAHKPDWLTKDIYFLRDTIDKIGLSFEYIALRDIKEGEEVFMDYGDEWVSVPVLK